ncbi:hypothetical protein chiPu_0029644 [Chiloscyllium punctatum]|uniref:Uncharacterized protein n=1 Tax=Chiloscyllium punctatum TaxID=137246 RepID=A0A401TSZ6_CHIPU|nr:hypothetical protein [Chiloscyllium punctatum]
MPWRRVRLGREPETGDNSEIPMAGEQAPFTSPCPDRNVGVPWERLALVSELPRLDVHADSSWGVFRQETAVGTTPTAPPTTPPTPHNPTRSRKHRPRAYREMTSSSSCQIGEREKRGRGERG